MVIIKKILFILPITILFILLSSNYKVFAANRFGAWSYKNDYPVGITSSYTNNTGYIFLIYYDSGGYYTTNISYTAVESIGSFINNSYPMSGSSSKFYFDTLVLDTGSIIDNRSGTTIPDNMIFNSVDDYEDYINPPQPEPTWYESLFNDFLDFINAGLGDGINGFIEWLKEAWTVPVGEGEDELAIDLITLPPPTPTPTPIPYQTVLQPDGNGGFQIQYIYVNPSGVPTSAPQPPSNNITNNYGSDFEYPYYNNPDNINDPYDLDIPWYLKFVFNDQTTSLSDFQDGIDATITTVNNSEEEINTVMDSMSIFPVEWLLMIGFIGAIPLVGGIISRLLKG